MQIALSRVAAVAAVTALGVGGCSGSGSTGSGSGSSGLNGGSKATGKTGDAGAPAGASLSGKVPSGFANATTWSTQVAWGDRGVGKAALDLHGHGVSNWVVAEQQGSFGVVRTVGTSVVVPSFASGGAAGPVAATLKFLDAKTGKPIAEKKLPSGTFLGLDADVVAGKPVAVVRYLPAQDDASPVVVVFDASGAQVWSTEGKQVAGTSPWSGGLQDGENGEGLLVGGYALRLNIGKDTSDHTDATYDVVDTTGKSVLHVPLYADKWDMNSVNIVQGYAVVSYDDSLSLPDTSTAKEHFTVYDLSAAGKKVAEVAEKDSGGVSNAVALAASGGKILLTWLGSGTGAMPPTLMTVLDTATGQATPPAPLPGAVTDFGTLIDPATKNVLFFDRADPPTDSSAMVSLSQGTVLWTQHDQHSSLIPLSMHNGVVYGIEAAELGSSDGNQLAVKEADGSPVDTDYELSPLDFTADGAPLFAEASDGSESDSGSSDSSGSGTYTVTVGVGHGA
ncbi:hypothetical protein Caci_5050 [Catenulispora acidiphila DSM 44928]|uniref:Lipoprotein n=1 Tax=Catenulispora acidiphila (strain DSM 44928 / JCM 14897 / NBRC 102108 / NRRL B-24433 / ID139908) TaxID=479433 RepID=C7Q4W2_CATAD|nr:hypothetical protein [Catenulispora acidiphila]ACU73910.1 hypothetical protein Caci_5050 [Catenulispora acidiphila DSM 44928]